MIVNKDTLLGGGGGAAERLITFALAGKIFKMHYCIVSVSSHLE